MSRKSRRELEREVDEIRSRADGTDVVAVGPGEGYLSPDEFRERYGESPAESDHLVIHVPAEAEGY
jgi:hypothetical protein